MKFDNGEFYLNMSDIFAWDLQSWRYYINRQSQHFL
jgi:hypothetical protein